MSPSSLLARRAIRAMMARTNFNEGVEMPDLRYEAPGSLADAVKALAAAGGLTRILAGGTDVIVQMETDLIEPELLVDIKKIPALRNITAENGGFRIGAAVSAMQMMDHAALCATFPGVIEGVKLIGSIQVKGRATVAGNLCNASPGADSVPPMVTAGAIAHVVGPNGARDVPVEQIPVSPGKTSLAKGEIIESFFLPAPARNSGGAYQRFTPRTEMDIAVVGVAVNLTLDGAGVCTAARVALGAVGPTVVVSDECAQALIGTKVDEAALEKLAAAASAACRPIDDKRGTKEFRIKVAAVLARRVAQQALERARHIA